MKKKIKYYVDADMKGYPNIHTQLVITADSKQNYATLNYGNKIYTLMGEELKSLVVITQTKATKNGIANLYKVKLVGDRDYFLVNLLSDADQIIQTEIEIPRAHTDLALHSLGQKTLSKEKLKKTIIDMYHDNFEALKALRKYGVIKNVEKDIEQTLSETKHKV